LLIREYTAADLDALRRIHAAQGFAYAFPNLDDPLFVSKLILEDDSGRIAMAAFARLTCEMYLLVKRTTGDRVIPSEARMRSDEDRAFCATTRDLSSICTLGNAESMRDAARARFAQFFALHAAGEKDLLARGLEDAHAWLPPGVARRFGRRLEALGWVRDDAWTPYSRRLSD
jgi:hypothetical protein